MNQLKHKAIKSVFWVGSTRAVGQLIAMAVTVFMMRILSPEDYGLMGMALSYQAIVFLLYDMGVGAAVLQKPDLTREDICSAFWFSTIFGLVLYGSSWFIAVFIGYFFSNESLVPLIRVLSLGNIFLAIQEVPFCIMAKRFEFKKRGIIELSASLLCLATSLFMAIKGYGVWSLVIGQVVREFLRCILILIFSGFKVEIYFSKSKLHQLLRFGIPYTGHHLLNYLNGQSDAIIIGRFLGSTALGYYQVAISLARMPIQKVIAIANKVIFPVFTEIQNDQREMQNYFYKIFHIISIFAFPVFLGLLSVSEEVVVLILTPKWLPSLFILRLFCIWAIFRSYIGFLLIILKSKGNTGAIFKYSLYSSVVLPVSFVIGVNFGISGVAIACLITIPIMFMYLLRLVKREIAISYLETFRNAFHALVGSTVMVAFIYVLKVGVFKNIPVSYETMGIYIATGIIVFFGYFYCFSKKLFHEILDISYSLRA